MIGILLHLRNSETIGRPRGFAYQVARNDLPQYVVPIPMLVRAAIEPPRNTGPIQMLVSGLFLTPEHPMPWVAVLAVPFLGFPSATLFPRRAVLSVIA